MNKKCNIVLTCLINFQDYIIINIEQLVRLGHENIYVLTHNNLIPNFKSVADKINIICIDNFEWCNHINKKHYSNRDNFRNGFWTLTTTRFFYIYEFMNNHNITDVIHLENDVLIYYNCDDNIIPKLDKKYVYVPFDTFARNIASIMYIPNCLLFKEILNNYDYSKNDMENFSIIKNKTKLIENLPIFISNTYNEEHKFVTSNFDKLNYIFDAAAIGQYIGGVDPRNIPGDTRGFINETCIIKYNNYKFVWNIIDCIKKPFIIINNLQYPIFNLHIHSKELNKYV